MGNVLPPVTANPMIQTVVILALVTVARHICDSQYSHLIIHRLPLLLTSLYTSFTGLLTQLSSRLMFISHGNKKHPFVFPASLAYRLL